MIAPASAGDLAPRQSRDLRVDRYRDAVGERGIVGYQDTAGGAVMFRLTQQIDGNPVRVRSSVGDHQNLRGPGDGVDPDSAEDHALGRRHIGIAGTDDDIDRLDGLGAIGQCGNRLRPADPIDFVDSRAMRCRQNRGNEFPIRRRYDHDQSSDPGDLSGNRVHQHRAGIGGRPAWNIEPRRADRCPAQAKAITHTVVICVPLRPLAAVEVFDPGCGKIDGGDQIGRTRANGGGDFIRTNAQSRGIDGDPIETRGIFEQRRIAFRRDTLQNLGDHAIDAFGIVSPLRKIGRETRLEGCVRVVQPKRHCKPL